MIEQAVREGRPLGVFVFDCHGHLGAWPDFPEHQNDVARMLEVMDRLGIARLAFSSLDACYCEMRRGNQEAYAAAAAHPDRLLAYAVINPNFPESLEAELARWPKQAPRPLIKLHPYLHRYPVTGPNYRPLWEFADRASAVVLSHTWESDPTCGPLLFEELARQYPGARIILGHSGVTRKGYEEAIQVARKYENVFLDTTGSQSHNGILERCVAEVGFRRVLFGSDLPFLEAAMGIGRVAFARLPESQKEAILGLNFRQLLEEG